MNGNLVESLIGAAVLFVATGFLYVAYTTTDIGKGSGGFEFEARFERIGGLSVGADVRVAGIKVGKVTSQSLDLSNTRSPAGIEFTVQRSIRIYENASARITSDGLLGDSYLDLTPGDSFEGTFLELEAGDQLEFTQSSIDFWALISKAVYSGGGDGDEEK